MVVAGTATGPDSGMAVTALFAAIPLVLGALMVKSACRLSTPPSCAGRGVILLYGFLGFVTWAGMIIGPVLAVAAACMPGCPECRKAGAGGS